MENPQEKEVAETAETLRTKITELVILLSMICKLVTVLIQIKYKSK